MNRRITVVDYDCGNLFSVSRAIEYCGGQVELARDPDRVARAERLILPGVGAFGRVMDALHERGLTDSIHEFAATGRPFLGICVGMQAMMDYSEEFGRHEGFGFVPGTVAPIPDSGADGKPHPVPHIGWSSLIEPAKGWNHTPLKDLQNGTAVYFVHSYAAEPVDTGHIAATCDYDGRAITAVVTRDNMTGCQFHPEKSGPAGLHIMQNFMSSR